MLPNDTYNMVEVAKLESAINGIIAGFALTIVILLIERLASKSSDISYDSTLGKAAITVFITTFFTSTLASFLFAVNAAEIENSARAFLLVMPPAFVFALSGILLILGLVLLLAAYKLTEALEPTKISLYMVSLLALFNYTYTASDVTAGIYKIPSVILLSKTRVLLQLFIPPAARLFIGFSLRKRR